MNILEDDESCSYKFSQVGLGLINYSFKCVQGDYIGKSFRLLHTENGQIIGSAEQGNNNAADEDGEAAAVEERKGAPTFSSIE